MPKIEVKLKQHTPILQREDQFGAGIRGTELKPALDRFLWARYGKSHAALLNSCRMDPAKPEQQALNYRVKIVGSEQKVLCTPNDLRKTGYYSCAMPGADHKPMYSDKEISVTFLSASAELLKLVKVCISEFFFCTNFGYRKSKGFGSYSVVRINGEEQNMPKLFAQIKSTQPGGKLYEITAANLYGCTTEQQFIKVLQSVAMVANIMKSGINFGGKYDRSILMKEYAYSNRTASGREKPSYSNEKRKMKEDIPAIRRISAEYDANCRSGIQKITLPTTPKPTKYRFSRAMLGFAEQYTFRNMRRESKEVFVYDAADPKNGGFRMQSSLLFKPIFINREWRVFILMRELPEGIYNREFYFSTYKFSKAENEQRTASERTRILNEKLTTGEAIKLATPAKEEFSLQDFMACTAAYRRAKQTAAPYGGLVGLKGRYPLIEEV